MARQDALWQNQQQTGIVAPVTTPAGVPVTNPDGTLQYQQLQKGTQAYNEQVLGMEDNQDGTMKNPFTLPTEAPPVTLNCEDGTPPDANGCCPGEVYTDMGEQGFNCCPDTGGDCFPPII
jgi:hypothetical protein